MSIVCFLLLFNCFFMSLNYIDFKKFAFKKSNFQQATLVGASLAFCETFGTTEKKTLKLLQETIAK